MVKIKVCGITDLEDAKLAIGLGAHAIGFVFARSPRQVSPEIARNITNKLPPFVQTVGVFVDEEMSKVRETIQFCSLDLVQLHGNESAQDCYQLMPRALKAIRVKDRSSLSVVSQYHASVRAILLDTYSETLAGGTGRTFDWSIAVEAKRFGIPIVLSGGLNIENITAALDKVRPFAVDVGSGLEKRPGKKDPELLKEFIDKVRSWGG